MEVTLNFKICKLERTGVLMLAWVVLSTSKERLYSGSGWLLHLSEACWSFPPVDFAHLGSELTLSVSVLSPAVRFSLPLCPLDGSPLYTKGYWFSCYCFSRQWISFQSHILLPSSTIFMNFARLSFHLLGSLKYTTTSAAPRLHFP